jgi:hypothetical protein
MGDEQVNLTSGQRVLNHCDGEESRPPWTNLTRIESDSFLTSGAFDDDELDCHNYTTEVEDDRGYNNFPSTGVDDIASEDLWFA